MQSVKATLTGIGVNTNRNVSVLGDLFGFFQQRVPADPDPSVTASVSVQNQLQALTGRHVHLNMITVGFDTLSAGDQQTANDKVDYAVYRTRNIFAQVNLGVGRVEHYRITAAESNGRDDLGSESEADDLSDEWSVPNDGIDVFLVRNISDTDFVGISPRPGDCDKGDKDDGLIGGEINRRFEDFSRTVAHEIGHFLDLPHNHGDNNCPSTTAGQSNLMAQTRCVIPDSTGNPDTRNSVLLTTSQGNTMRGRCQVRNGLTDGEPYYGSLAADFSIGLDLI